MIIDSKSRTTILLNCPNCGHLTETHSLAFLAATNFGALCICDDCKKEYYVEIHCLTRADELRNEADDVGQGMASHTEDDDEINGNLETGA